MTHLPLTPWRYGESMDAWLYPHVREKLAELILGYNIKTVLEIGTCYGCSAIWFAQRVRTVICVDLWLDIPEHTLSGVMATFLRNRRASGLNNIYQVIGDSHNGKTKREIIEDYDRPDLVYLDGDHTYEGVKKDIEMYGQLARKVLCGDDYDVNLPTVAGVIRAVDECVPDRKTHGRLWYVEK